MNDLEKLAWGEPDREKDRDTDMMWALGLSILALGVVFMPAASPVVLSIGVFLAIGAAATLVMGLGRSSERRHVTPPEGKELRDAPLPSVSKERELLTALRDGGGSMTPVEAAIETSLTVREADEMFSELAGGGHLAVESRNGALFYSLPGRSSRELER